VVLSELAVSRIILEELSGVSSGEPELEVAGAAGHP